VSNSLPFRQQITSPRRFRPLDSIAPAHHQTIALATSACSSREPSLPPSRARTPHTLNTKANPLGRRLKGQKEQENRGKLPAGNPCSLLLAPSVLPLSSSFPACSTLLFHWSLFLLLSPLSSLLSPCFPSFIFLPLAAVPSSSLLFHSASADTGTLHG